MERKDIDKKYKWDLSEIYKNEDAYKEDKERLLKLVDNEESYKGRVLESSKSLQEILDLDTEIERVISKMYVFRSLQTELDTRDGKAASSLKELMDLYSTLSVRVSFISTELSKLTKEKMEEFIKENPNLEKYRFTLTKIIRHSKHILSLENEELLSAISPVIDVGSDVFNMIDNADIVLEDIKDSKGKKHKLTSGTFNEYVRSNDRTLRKEAYYKMHEYYKKHENAISECLASHIKTDVIFSRLRKYNSALESHLMDDNLDEKFYNKVIDDANKNLKTLHRMMRLHKKALGVDELHIYDLNARIGKLKDKKYTIDEIIETVKDALGIMGPSYMKVVNEAFDENWVDFYETPGKRSGAFSSGCYDTKPYLLLNATGSFDDIETLAHELGHSIHSYYSNKNRTQIDADYPIFLAEIASTTHEILLNDYLLKSAKDNEMKKYILNNILAMYKSTVFRQVEFGEFEKIVFDKTEAGENLTKDDFTNIYLDLQNKYYGKDVINDEIIKYECLRIPHFYRSFYVYKYATSLCIAYHFASDIINKKENAVENYIKFISSGGKAYPLDILKECGIDLEKEDIMSYSIKLIEKYMDELEKLI